MAIMFQSKVIIEKIIGGDTWRVHEDIVYDAGASGIITIPEGFVTDLASIPHALPLAMAVNTEAAAIVHDWLYTTGKLSRKTSDAVLFLALIDSGVSLERATTIYEAVRVGGVVAWKEHRSKDK
jgi:hypothetical protein